MRRAFYSLAARSWSAIDFFSLKVCESLNNMLRITRALHRFEKIFLILSVDAERDTYLFEPRMAGWENGVPYILDTFSEYGVHGKACWLIEYNVRDGLFFCKPSKRHLANHENIIREIKQKGYEFGLHPTMYAYDQSRWDYKRALSDPAFVSDVIHQGTEALVSVCKKRPVGCRTGHFHFALGLAKL